MAKGIIVMEIPEKCEDCPLARYVTLNDRFCCITGKNVYIEQMFRHPDWCPVHPMPQRKEVMGYGNYSLLDFERRGRQVGWNDCVDYLEQED